MSLFRLQYIRDVLLPTPSLFEEHKFAVLNSYLLMNKTEIVQTIQVCMYQLCFMYIHHLSTDIN